MTPNTSFMQCTSSKNCKVEELCVLDQNATTGSYECQPKTSVQKDMWIIENNTLLPQWYPPEDRKTYGQGCQHPPISTDVDGYYGNCQDGLFCDKDSNTCMNQFNVGDSCISNNQCISKNCDKVCSLLGKSPNKKQDMVIVIALVILAVAGSIISYFAIRRLRRERKVQKKLTGSGDNYDEVRISTPRLSSGNTSTFRTTSLVTINGENIISGPYFGDRNLLNFNDEVSYPSPSYRENLLSVSGSGESNRELQERRHTFDVLSRPQSILRNSLRNSLSDKRISKTSVHSYYSLNDHSESFKDAFDEFPPPAY